MIITNGEAKIWNSYQSVDIAIALNMNDDIILIIVNIKSFTSNNLGLFHYYGMLLQHTQLGDVHAQEWIPKLQNAKYCLMNYN